MRMANPRGAEWDDEPVWLGTGSVSVLSVETPPGLPVRWVPAPNVGDGWRKQTVTPAASPRRLGFRVPGEAQ